MNQELERFSVISLKRLLIQKRRKETAALRKKESRYIQLIIEIVRIIN